MIYKCLNKTSIYKRMYVGNDGNTFHFMQVWVLFESEDGWWWWWWWWCWGVQSLCGIGERRLTAQPRMRTDDKTPQRPQETVVGDGGVGGIGGGR